jgi:hypothetical protein
MADNKDYMIRDLFEAAKKDPSWEEDPAKRERLAEGFYNHIISSLS